MHYNPFAYIHNEKDILKLVTVLIANTKGAVSYTHLDVYKRQAQRLPVSTTLILSDFAAVSLGTG